MTDSKVVEILAPIERDQAILQLRLSGVSVARLARQYHLTERAVCRILDKLLPVITPETRARYLRESLGTLDQLQSWWTADARSSPAAAGLLLKIQEQRSTLLGLNAPMRLDPIQIVAAATPERGSSTQDMLDALNRIVRERERKSAATENGAVIEHDPTVN